MKLLVLVLLAACGVAPVAHASITRKVKACHPNCGRVYQGYNPKKPYYIKDPFPKKKALKLAAAAPTTTPPPPPPPPVDPCIEHVCSPSY